MRTDTLSRTAALFRAAVLCGVLSACGGGGGETPAPVAPPAPAPAPAPFAYLLHSSKVEVCRIDSSDALVACEDVGEVVPGFLKMRAMAVSGSNAYLANDDLNDASPIIHCRIEATGALTGCAKSGETGSLAEPRGLRVHGSTLYIGKLGNPIVRKCEIKDDGSLDGCGDAQFPGAMATSAADLQIVGTKAYILHGGENLVSRCDVLPDGTLSNCANAGATGLDRPQGSAISGNYMYVANEGSEGGAGPGITRCVFDSNGLLGDCVDAGANVSSPNHIAIRGSVVYITNSGPTDSLTRCTAGGNGLLTGCTSVSGNGLHSVVLK